MNRREIFYNILTLAILPAIYTCFVSFLIFSGEYGLAIIYVILSIPLSLLDYKLLMYLTRKKEVKKNE